MRKTILVVILLASLILAACSPGALLPPTPTATQAIPPGVTGTPTGSAIEWERSGGIAGICQHLSIEFSGHYTLIDCVKSVTISTGELSPADFDLVSQLWNTYSAITWQVPRSSGADQFVDNYSLNGIGEQVPTGEKQAEINDTLAAIATKLAASQPTPAAQESGIQGQVMLGPTCPVIPATGPAATQCADKPYQASIEVLDQGNQLVTTIQTDAQGQFKVSLPPGTYTLHPLSPAIMPRGQDQTVTVPAGQYVQVKVQYDSGIR